MPYHGGDQGLLAYALETGTSFSSYGFTTTLPAIPASPAIIGYARSVPELRTTRGAGQGYGVGSPYALYKKKGVVVHNVGLDLNLASLPFLGNLVRGGSGYKGLNDLAFYTGVENSGGDGYVEVVRMAKNSTFGINIQEGPNEIQVQAAFMGMARQEGSDIAPSFSALAAPGTPLFFHNLLSLDVGGEEFRNLLMGLSITGNHNLEVKGVRPDMGDDIALSRAPYAFLPHNFDIRAELTMHSRLAAAFRNSTVNATHLGDITVYVTNADVTPFGETAKYLTATLVDCILDEDAQTAVEQSGQMSHTASIIAADLVFDITEPE